MKAKFPINNKNKVAMIKYSYYLFQPQINNTEQNCLKMYTSSS